jgi:hypothetical protein
MSFDVFAQRFRDGESASANRAGVVDVLARIGVPPNADGWYLLRAPDGGEVEMSARGLDGSEEFESVGFFLRDLTPGLAELIFDIAKAGEMIIYAAMEGQRFILTALEQKGHVPEVPDWPEPILCTSGQQLAALLSGGYDVWIRYRDQVTGRR